MTIFGAMLPHPGFEQMVPGLAPAQKVPNTVDNLSPSAAPLAVSVPRPLRILHIIPDISVAGAEMKLYKLLVATRKERFASMVISMRDRGELRQRIEALGIPVYSLGIRGSLPGPKSVSRLIRIVRETRPEVIHGWMYHGSLAAQFAAAFAHERPAVLWSVHQSLYSFAYEKWLTALVIRLDALLSRAPRRILYASKTSASQHEAIGYKKERTLVLDPGFDTEKFSPSEEARLSVRRELDLQEDALLIGLIGRYHAVKDHGNYLRAAEIISQNHSNARFIMCGAGVDHKNASLRALIRERRLEGRTFLLGERPDIERIVAALDIVASSSCSEGFPNVVGEAMSAGVPCVVTAVSDLPDVVGTTGRIVPPRDSPALAEGIEELISIGPLGRQALGAVARARIIERYSLDSSVAQYEALHEGIAAQAQNQHHDPLCLPACAPAGIVR
jgi:glycosyltransferase involved in cell wall biosynthesis